MRKTLRGLIWVQAVSMPILAIAGIWGALACAICSATSTLLVFRRIDTPWAARWGADVCTVGGFFTVFVATIEGAPIGGVLNNWWFLIPTMAALLGVRKGALFWCAATMLAASALITLFGMGYLQPTADPATVFMHSRNTFLFALASCISVTIIFVRDVTDYREHLHGTVAALEREVAARRAAEAKALQAMEVRTRFLALMSHEIRTPLHGVLGMNQLLDETDLDREQGEFVRVALAAGHSLRGIVDEVLEHSRLESGMVALDPGPFAPRAFVESCVALFSSRAREEGLSLAADVDPNLPAWLHGDDHRLRQVLLNLLGNAVKFTHDGGVKVRALHRDGVLDIAVTDTGIGISEEAMSMLFQPFVQAGSSTPRQYGGTGLGLCICRELVELMGGTLEASSVLGEGTTFRMTLPMEPCDAPPPPEATEEVRGRSMHILLAEDNLVSQLLATRLLEKDGHTVVVARNGLEAVEHARRESFDLVLMDVCMPELGGLDATVQIRALGGPAARVPIVALSASAMEEDRRACLAAGMDDFLCKPLDFAVFRSKLAALSTAEREEEPELALV